MASRTILVCLLAAAGIACSRTPIDDGRVDSGPPYSGYPRVSAGTGKSCLLDAAGRLSCWGNILPAVDTVPERVFADVDLGNSACGLERDGTLTCWPKQELMGVGAYPAGRFSRVSVSSGNACAVRLDGALACWGEPSYGMTDPPQGKFREVALSGTHACAIRRDGTLACWGLNGDGQATPPPGAFVSVASGTQHSCARNVDDVVACWGAPDTFGHLHNQIAQEVHCGDTSTCVIHRDGTLECTGRYPQLRQPPSGRFVQMDIGLDHACAVRADGSVACWGGNLHGQSTPPAR